MSGVEPGWYPDPGAPETQRYWDGEQWVGAPIPVDAPSPSEPPEPEPPAPPVTAYPPAPESGSATLPQYPRVPTTFPPPQSGQQQPGSFGQNQPGQYGKQPVGTPAFPPAFPPPGAPQPAFFGGVQLASLGSRLGARLIDLFALFLLNVLVNGYFFVQYYQALEPTVRAFTDAVIAGRPRPELTLPAEAERLNLIMTLVAIGLWFAYEVPGVANRGQTLGKRLLGIKVATMDGSAVRFGQSIRRWFIVSFPAMIGVCGWPIFLANVLWCVWDRPARQCLHDKASRTVVVVAERAPRPGSPGAPNADVKNDNQARHD